METMENPNKKVKSESGEEDSLQDRDNDNEKDMPAASRIGWSKFIRNLFGKFGMFF